MTGGPEGRQPMDSEVPLELLIPPWWLRESKGLRGSASDRKDRPRPMAGPERPGPPRRASPEAPGDGAAAAHALVERVREAIRERHYSPRTEKSYAGWVRRFLAFHRYADATLMGATEVRAYLTHLATDRSVSASTQNQAFSALLFLFRAVLGRKLEDLDDTPRAKRPTRLPVVLSRSEARAGIDHLPGRVWLV